MSPAIPPCYHQLNVNRPKLANDIILSLGSGTWLISVYDGGMCRRDAIVTVVHVEVSVTRSLNVAVYRAQSESDS